MSSIKPTLVLLAAGLIAVAAVAFVATSRRQSRAKGPERPRGVPEQAVWIGAEKGEWLACFRVAPSSEFLDCTWFNHPRGQRISTGRYLWKQATGGNELPTFVSFDGNVIASTTGDVVPIGKHTFFVSDSDTYEKDYGEPVR